MMKKYESPSVQVIDCVTAQDILAVSEEAFDINVSFDTLWGTGV